MSGASFVRATLRVSLDNISEIVKPKKSYYFTAFLY